MSTHFPTVPVETALRNAPLHTSERLRPLVLVVEDEPVLTVTLAAILNKSGLAALTASDPRTALDLAALMPPDILVADARMPEMGGLELAIQVRQLVPDCDVVLSYGHACSKGDLHRLQSLGQDFVTLTKPVHPADLIEQVFQCLQKRGFPELQSPSRLIPRLYELPLQGRLGHRPDLAEERLVLRPRTKVAARPD